MAQLLAHQGEAHELFVLVAVADDEVVGRLRNAENCLELRLAATLQSHTVRLAKLEDLFDDVPLLIHLDRVHRRIAARIRELGSRLVEARRQGLDAGAKNVREAQQHRHRNALLLEIHGDVVQIDLVLRALLVRLYDDVAARIDVEKAATPALDIIEGARGVDAPGCGLRCRRRRFYDMCRHGRNNSRCALRTAFVHMVSHALPRVLLLYHVLR